jgi:hypothetical protein
MEETTLFAACRGVTTWTLLVVASQHASPAEVGHLIDFARRIEAIIQGGVTKYIIVGRNGSPILNAWDGSVLLDETGDLRVAYGVTASTMILVRPDGHVAFRYDLSPSSGTGSQLSSDHADTLQER